MVVPAGVRSGTVRLTATTIDNDIVTAGALGFTAPPAIVGVAIGADGMNGLLQSFTTAFAPGTVEVYGYNMTSITAAAISDGQNPPVDADVAPAAVAYPLPAGMTAVSITVPAPSVELFAAALLCEVGTGPYTFALTATLPSGAVVGLPPFDVQGVDASIPGVLPDIAPATVSGVLLPSGVRGGEYTISYQLFESGANGAQTRWDLTPQFRDPAIADDSDPAAWRDCASIETTGFVSGRDVIPGQGDHPSPVDGLVGPGAFNQFVWDTNAPLDDGGLPGGRFVTRLRLVPDNPEEVFGDIGTCDNGVWETGPIVIDNTPSAGPAVIEESFDSFATLDETNGASWNPASGLLVGSPIGDAPFGTGTTSMMLLAGESYSFNTDTGSASRLGLDAADLFTDLGTGPNPGAAADPPEFWVSDLTIEQGAQITILGSNPFVVRCSGLSAGSPDVFVMNGVIDLSGGGGGDATTTAVGTGGEGGAAGGGAGGPGGFVQSNGANAPGAVDGASIGGSGGNNGGEPGQPITLLRPYDNISNPRAGPGGGGGHRDAGFDGINTLGSGIIKSQSGLGGPARGNPEMTVLTAGAGGGGGAGCVLRQSPDPDNPVVGRFGGGGGGGGGAMRFVADGNIVIGPTGALISDGGTGGDGTNGGGASPGGGGSGGGILLQAEGSVLLDSDSLIRAMGGSGANNGNTVRGGPGSPGRIRIEANGPISLPGLVNFDNVQAAPSGTFIGQVATAIDGGDSGDGSFDFAAQPDGSLIVIDTDTGIVTNDSNGSVLYTPVAFDGIFDLTGLVVPGPDTPGFAEGITVRAFGDSPLVFRVNGNAEIDGTIDASGFDGGQIDVITDPLTPGAGVAGPGGPAGGFGGAGGFDDGTDLVDGAMGSLPTNLPAELVGDPLNSPGNPGGPAPAPLAFPSTGGESISLDDADVPAVPFYPGHGVGGGSATDGLGFGSVVGPVQQEGTSGEPGTSYGTLFLQHPINGEPLRVGGSGGSGGGSNSNVTNAINSPGTGGGGAGGYLELTVSGALVVGAQAQILANGGNAYQSLEFGGNGGGGAGGVIRIEGDGLVIFETDDDGNSPVISAAGGLANLEPTIDLDLDDVPDYGPLSTFPSNGQTSAAGNGAAGRVVIRAPIPFNTNPDAGCDIEVFSDDGTPPGTTGTKPLAGICPEASVGAFLLGSSVLSSARTLPFNVQIAGGVRNGSLEFLPATFDFSPPIQPDGTDVVVLFEGAFESLDAPGQPGPFFGLVEDPTQLNGVEFIRMNFFLFANLGTSAVPTLDAVTLEADLP